MAVSQHLPSWRKYDAKNCVKCHADCCRMPVEVSLQDLVRAEIIDEGDLDESPKRIAARLKKEGIVKSFRARSGLFTLTQRANLDCVFLDKNSLCTIYDKRPEVCRQFPTAMGPRPGFCPCRLKSISL